MLYGRADDQAAVLSARGRFLFRQEQRGFKTSSSTKVVLIPARGQNPGEQRSSLPSTISPVNHFFSENRHVQID